LDKEQAIACWYRLENTDTSDGGAWLGQNELGFLLQHAMEWRRAKRARRN
jgi:hypothetical protein